MSCTVAEVDEHTETVQMRIQGYAIDIEAIQSMISDIGGSLHSICRKAVDIYVIGAKLVAIADMNKPETQAINSEISARSVARG